MNMQQQDTKNAEKDFTLASNVDPDNCDVYHHRGQVSIFNNFLKVHNVHLLHDLNIYWISILGLGIKIGLELGLR